MGGGAILIVSKNRLLFVQRLSVFLFFRELQKIRPPARKKKLEENSGPDPLSLSTGGCVSVALLILLTSASRGRKTSANLP
jgi:hypothetical protein